MHCGILKKWKKQWCELEILVGWNQSENTFRDLANFKSLADMTAEKSEVQL